MSRARAGAGKSSRSAAALEMRRPHCCVSHSHPSIPHGSFHLTRTQSEKTGPRRWDQSRRVTVDRVAWFELKTAKNKILKGQAPFLDQLIEKIEALEHSSKEPRPFDRTE